MSRQILMEALNLLTRDHHKPAGQWLIAVDRHGNRVRPISPYATGFSVIGALCKVAAGQTITSATPYADLSAAGEKARELLAEMAGELGYLTLAEVDREGLPAVRRVFAAALNNCEPESRRPFRAVGTGTGPKGVLA